MSIQKRPHCIHHRVLLIVAFHQHGIKRRNAAMSESPGAFHQAREFVQHGRCVPFRCRWLTRCQPNLALGHRKPRQRVHYQQYIFPFIRKRLGNRGSQQRRSQSQQRRLIGSRHHHHRTPPALVSQHLQEFANLAAALAHQPDDELLRRIAAQVDDLLPGVLAAPERPHAFHVQETGVFSEPRPDGRDAVVKNAFPDCVVSGRANPMGIAARLWREGDEAVCQVTLGEAFEGAPGRAHGGIVASLIDETMGLVISMARTPAYTGRLTVTYRAPTPVGQLLEVRSRLADRSGRKLTITAELKAGGTLLAQGEGLFIAVDPNDFFTPS